MTGIDPATSRRFDPTVADPTRRHNYWLGGKDHFAADRESGDAIEAVFPTIRLAVAENRRFLRRVVTFLAHAGVRQFVDIGPGIPTAGDTHGVAQAVVPEARVVYVDNDPLVLAHARALVTSTPEGATACVEADLRDPDAIVRAEELDATLDLSEPVGLLLFAVMQHIDDHDDPYGILGRLVGALPAGSHLAISHPTFDVIAPDTAERLAVLCRASGDTFRARTREEFARFFQRLDLIPPGVGSITEWRTDWERRPRAAVEETAMYGAVARLS